MTEHVLVPCPFCDVDVGAAPLEARACSHCGRDLVVCEHYRIVELLGRGGMGAVYGALDESGHRVAAKVLTLKSANDWTAWELFERSSRVLMGLKHSGLPKVYAFARDEPARLILVREAFDGGSLAERIAADQRISAAVLRQLAVSLLEILAYLQSLVPPIIHRDIKPANIMFRSPESWDPVLADFDTIAAPESQRTGLTIVGTIGYAAPEQLTGEATPSSDVFGLGATLLKVVTHTDPDKLPRHHGRLVLGNALDGLDATFAHVLQRMVETDPAHRFADARAVLAALATPATAPADESRDAASPSRASALGPGERREGAPVVDAALATGTQPAGNSFQRLRLRHGRTAARIGGLLAIAGVGLIAAALAFGFVPASRGGHAVASWYAFFVCGSRQLCSEDLSFGGQLVWEGILPLGIGMLFASYFRRRTRSRIERGSTQGNFSWRDLAKINLSGLELGQCNFKGSDMRGVDLSASRLTQCELQGADLRGARLDNTTFIQCHFDGARLGGASLTGVTFVQCEPRALDELSATASPSAAPVDNPSTFVPQRISLWRRIAPLGGFGIPLVAVVVALIGQRVTRPAASVGRTDRPIVRQEQSCANGNADDCYKAGANYETGAFVGRDLPRAARFYREACNHQSSHACVALGDLYKRGAGVGADASAAHALYLKACALKYSYGCELACQDLLYGQGVGVDPAAAFDYCTRSCDAKYAPPYLGGCTTLGTLYADGIGTKRDYFQAAALLSSACNSVPRACLALADLADNGHGVKQDHARAFYLRYSACRQKLAAGCEAVESSYRSSPTATLELLSASCTNGDPFACDKIRELRIDAP